MASDELFDEFGGDAGGMFEEPAGFRPPTPPPTEHLFARSSRDGAVAPLRIKLVGHHSLWAHCLWNAGVYVARLMDTDPSWVKGKRVVEFGAAAALPSLLAALNDAEKVVITDYPERSLVENIEYNVLQNIVTDAQRSRVCVKGFLWGADPTELLAANGGRKFDLLLLCDLVFNHNQHVQLLRSCKECIAEDGKVLVAFTHHRPWLADKDMAFFALAQDEPFGFEVRRIFEDAMDPMFPNDPGDAQVRGTVHGFEMRMKR